MIDDLAISYPREALAEQVAGIDARAASLAAEAGSPARTALLAQKAELSDRQWLAGVKADVLAEIERRKRIARLEEAQRDTLTNRITPWHGLGNELSANQPIGRLYSIDRIERGRRRWHIAFSGRAAFKAFHADGPRP